MSKSKSLCKVKILLEPHDEPWWKFHILSGLYGGKRGGGVVCMFCEGSIFLIYLVAINVLIALQFTGQFGMVCY